MSVHESAEIHQMAVVEGGAVIGPNCKIGAFCVVGPEVTLGEGVELKSHVVVEGWTEIGDGTIIFPFASIGHIPQDLKFGGERTKLEIGKRNRIREHVTMNPGTEGGGGLTKVGDDGLYMMGVHIGHDCIVGNNVVLANNASLGGHCIIEDFVVMGALSGVHQFCRIGRGAMIGGLAAVVADVIPYGTVMGDRATLEGLNLVGLKRRGSEKNEINGLRAAFKLLFTGTGSLRERAGTMQMEYASNALVQDVTDFILEDSSRHITTPKGS
ncbi:acyl-ACP--UDP-N-acetylglucosamine O-acyltransferase [Amylibacter sp. IMCC11727]|uniref:acyl-ACP--UDP-N-acetylglucosamine O-acyltransferase n=1 Tax=Amylibacter sp. IMCC11727 TaxID=3039851 RepID=UPI00244E1C14|nr:acyl-ACP--UDP-N-acetylglucosamine O-acyltransferase [Amylibacter sp. IMCC11727]WGI20685.1 acyl-ACP--UDP-N-acetylglucosamine O-acyltransferase [Amylibacter sp. IMCC11727]